MDITCLNASFWLEHESDCLDLLKNNWGKVPLLNCNEIHNLKSGRLVRFRGMIQDMYNPEYYLEKYEVLDEISTETRLCNGKYMDTVNCKDKEIVHYESPMNVASERSTFVMITTPALNQWALEMEMKENKIEFNRNSCENVTNHPKRSLEDEDKGAEATSPGSSNKKQCSNKTAEVAKTFVSPEHLLNFPLPNSSGKACHIKIYDKSDSIKLNDLIEVVGFLSVDPNLIDEDEDVESQTHNPPPSLVPRIHCVNYKPFSSHSYIDDSDLGKPLEVVNKELMIVLTQLLLGDALAAEYLIYHLISKVYNRQDLMPLGKFALNLSNIPLETPNFGEEIYKILEQIIPKSYYLPMTLENMNDLTFIPKKDYDCNRVTSGILQLSDNTHLVLDETKLSTGKLNEAGVKAVGAIATAIKNQRMDYDFGFYKMDYECDIAFLILSEGKSMLPSDFHVALKPESDFVSTFGDIVEAAKVFLNTFLREARMYLAMARKGQYELSESIQESIQTEFVNMRQRENASVDDLHSLLVLARLICMAQGKTVLDNACWNKACQLEAQRKARLPK